MAIDQKDLEWQTDGLYPNFGWADLPDEVEAVSQTLTYPVFSDTPLAQAMTVSDIPEETLAWRVWRTVTGKDWPELNQLNAGTCCAFATVHALMETIAAEILLGDPEAPVIPSPEVIYAISRVNVGGGRLGRGDGSTGAWVAKAARDFGLVEMTQIGEYDLSKYSPGRAQDWGWRGVPKVILEAAKAHPITDITQIRTFDEACIAIASGKGIIIASSIGYNGRRDSEGFIKPSGRWLHAMNGNSYTRRPGKRWGLFILNSWGFRYHTGGLSHPDMPPGGFWVDPEHFERMARQGDTWAVAGVNGWTPRRILAA
jgi:hypothetical protein